MEPNNKTAQSLLSAKMIKNIRNEEKIHFETDLNFAVML